MSITNRESRTVMWAGGALVVSQPSMDGHRRRRLSAKSSRLSGDSFTDHPCFWKGLQNEKGLLLPPHFASGDSSDHSFDQGCRDTKHLGAATEAGRLCQPSRCF